MDKSAIMEFAGIYLDKYKRLTVPDLQKYIMNRDEVGKAIAIEDIEDALGMLYYARFIEVSHNSANGTVYKKDKS